MSAEVTHKNHHESHIAYGTGRHRHHRATMDLFGIRMAFWKCDMGTAPLHACPDEPDPMERLLVKAAKRRRREPEPTEAPVCTIHPVDRQKAYNGKRMCLTCQQERDRRKRARQVADRIARTALKVA